MKMKIVLCGLLFVGCSDSSGDACSEIDDGIYRTVLIKKSGDCPEEYDESTDRIVLPRGGGGADEPECISDFSFNKNECVYSSDFRCVGLDEDGEEIRLNFSGDLDVISSTRLEGEQELELYYAGERVCKNTYEATFTRE